MIDAEQRLAAYQRVVVDASDSRPQQAVLIAGFQRQGFGVRDRHRRGIGGEFHIAQLATACGMDDAAVAGGQFAGCHTPTRRRRTDQHGASHGTGTAQTFPVHGDGKRTAGELRAVGGGIDGRLLNANILPGGVHLFGDDHRQRRLHALADFGVLGEQQDAGFVDAQKAVRLQGPALGRGATEAAGAEREHQPAANHAGEFQKLATIDLVDAERDLLRRLGNGAGVGNLGDGLADALIVQRHGLTPDLPPPSSRRRGCEDRCRSDIDSATWRYRCRRRLDWDWCAAGPRRP